MSDVLKHHLIRNPHTYVGLRTQNPAMLKAAQKSMSIGNYLPFTQDLEKEKHPTILQGLAKKLSMHNIDLQTGIERGTYGRGLYDQVPVCTEKPFSDLNLANGDCALFVGKNVFRTLGVGQCEYK